MSHESPRISWVRLRAVAHHAARWAVVAGVGVIVFSAVFGPGESRATKPGGGPPDALSSGAGNNLIPNGWLQPHSEDARRPAGFDLTGAVEYGRPSGDRERVGPVVRFQSGPSRAAHSAGGKPAGSMTTEVGGISPALGRWFRLRIEAMAQDGFAVSAGDDLWLDVAFFRDRGAVSLDHIQKAIYPQIVAERRALADAGTNPTLGGATWRCYDLEFRTPFPEVDTLKLSVGFSAGAGKASNSEFWIQHVELTPIPAAADYQPPAGGKIRRDRGDVASLTPLGGRWYYDPAGGGAPPERFDHRNAHQLFYLAENLEAPFADNMSAWLRRGFLDVAGEMVREDRFIDDNVIVSFTPTHLVMQSHGLPNHATGVFPDANRSLDGNPNVIQEQRATWRIPLEPRDNPQHKAMKNKSNSDGALPMGPIGVAVNGVVFFNPFDHLLNEDAVWRLDRCCGHPSPNSLYHYHKYPVCVKSPWSDDGSGHSPLIGFAFDGFPIYGPYEAAGELAKSSRSNPLNEFNIHNDDARGWHYHVTPGQFPHIIGGLWGEFDASNRRGPPAGGPGGRGTGRGGPGRGGPTRFGPPPGNGPPGAGSPGLGPPADRGPRP